MQKTIFVAALAMCLCGWQPVAGQVDIAFEGTVSAGGGALNYQYTLRNIAQNPLVMTEFYLGTQDLNPANYSAWLAPAGMTPAATIIPTPSLPPTLNVMGTTGTKTPLGAVPPPPPFASAGNIIWAGNVTIPVGGTVTFGFNNANAAWDVEWLASGRPVTTWVSIGNSGLPIAGPLGIYSGGFVHSPVPEPSSLILLLGPLVVAAMRRNRARSKLMFGRHHSGRAATAQSGPA
jgi:hypothetical protein